MCATFEYGWWAIMATQTPVTLAIIVIALWGSTYHGSACQRINPVGCRRGAVEEGELTRRVLGRIGTKDTA